MKTDFLKTLGLTEEQIAEVMKENGKDIESLKTANEAQKTELETLKPQLAEAGKTIEGFKAMDVDAIRAEADKWKTQAEKAEQDAATKIAELQFNTLLDGSITAAKGKNSKAIRALLDLDVISKSKNQSEDITKALKAVQEENGYLFETDSTPPPYAGGTGTQSMNSGTNPFGFNFTGVRSKPQNENKGE